MSDLRIFSAQTTHRYSRDKTSLTSISAGSRPKNAVGSVPPTIDTQRVVKEPGDCIVALVWDAGCSEHGA